LPPLNLLGTTNFTHQPRLQLLTNCIPQRICWYAYISISPYQISHT